MSRHIYIGFAAVCYLIFFVVFLYLVGFLADLPQLPMTVDRPVPAGGRSVAAAVDLLLILLFALQHSGMARAGFKRMWTRVVPVPVERAIYVLAASLALVVLMAFWRAIPETVWKVSNPLGAGLLWALFGAGWLIVLSSTFLLNHFELFGLAQVWHNWRGTAAAAPTLRQPLFYRLVRHPLYAGFFLAFWATPHMTAGHLLLAGGMSVFMLAAIRLEERDLVGLFGAEYEAYRSRVGMLVPGIGRRG